MRYTEIVLKLLFLVGGVMFMFTKDISSLLFQVFLVVSILLGVVLLLNKDASYHFKQTKRDLIIRRVEGGLLIIFATIVASLGL